MTRVSYLFIAISLAVLLITPGLILMLWPR